MRLILLFLICGLSLFASIGKISALNGKIVVDRQKQLLDANVGFDLEEKDLIITDDKSKAQITLNDGTVLSLGKNSKLDINEYVYDEKDSSNSKANFKFAEGTFKSITGAIGKVSPEKFKLETKSASIGIRGTIVVGSQEKIACTHGKIEVTSAGVTQVLNAGMMTNTEQGKPPTTPTKIEGNLLNEVDGEAGATTENSESTTSQSNETTEENTSESTTPAQTTTTESTTNPVSFSNITSVVNNNLITEKIKTIIEEKTAEIIEPTTNISFYSVTKNISEEQNVGSTIFNVLSNQTTVTIATYAPTSGMDPVVILLKENEDGSYSRVSSNDDSWTKSGSAYNSILRYTLAEGKYKISVADFPFNELEAENEDNKGSKDEGSIQLYFSSTQALTFDDNTISTYSYNSLNNNVSYIQKPIENSITSPSPVILDTIISNNAQFGILADSDVGTTISIENYGVFVTISDFFDLSNSNYNNEEMYSYSYDSTSSNNVFLNTTEIDDGSSWGYWTSDFTNLSNVRDLKSAWVSGNQVTPPTNYSASFSGQVIGSVTNGQNSGHIILNSDNKFNATIDIGRATITNSLIQFSDSLDNFWNGTFDANGTSNVNPQGFSSNNITGTVSLGESTPSSITAGSLSGKYFGTNGTVQSIGGEFNMTNGTTTATGNFKAREFSAPSIQSPGGE